MAWTSDDLVADIRLRAQLPDAASDGAFTDANLLSFADDEISTRIVPVLRDAREDYWIAQEDTACDGSTVDFPTPTRAQSNTLRDVLLVGSGGNEQSIPRVPSTQMWRYGTSGALRFAMLGDVVRLVGETPSSDYTLRLRYYRRPSKLVESTACAQVTSVTASDVEATAAIFTTNDLVDLVEAVPPFRATGDSFTATVSGTTHSFVDSDAVAVDPSTLGVAVGDWVCPEGQTCVVPLPTELFPLLSRLTVTAVLEAKGDRQGANSSWIVAERLLAELKGVVQPRVDGEAKRVINRNSPLRYRRNRGR